MEAVSAGRMRRKRRQKRQERRPRRRRVRPVRQTMEATSGRWPSRASAGQGADGRRDRPEETWTRAGNLANGSGSQCEGPWLQRGGLEGRVRHV